MRFARYRPAGTGGTTAPPVSAVVVGTAGEVRLHALRGSTTVLDLAGAGQDAAQEAADWAVRSSPGVAVPDIRLLPPVAPPSIRDFVTFEEHVEGVVRSVGDGAEVPAAWYDAPTFYFTNPHSLVGAYDDVAVPPGCSALDFELEVAAVVGRGGTNLAPAAARDHVFGYTIFNDWSARDLQGREMQVNLGPAKGKDFATTLGPWIVTPDELEAYRDDDGFLALDLSASVDGDVIGTDLLSNASWTFEEMIAYASRGAWVAPGDVLGSGTCGRGCLAEMWGRRGRQDPPPLSPGSVMRLDVQGIGTVENLVVTGPSLADIPAIPRARARGTVRRPRHHAR